MEQAFANVDEPKLISRPARKNGGSTTPARGSTSPSKPHRAHKDPNKSNMEDGAGKRSPVPENLNVESEEFRARATEIMRFRVYARVRPFIQEELAEMEGQERRSVVEMTDNKTVILDPKSNWTPKAQFEFDASLWSIPPEHRIVYTFNDTKHKTYASQKDVYDVIAKDLVPHVFDGFNSCVLTYGLTGSGKTYTMMGKYDPAASCGGDGEEGIIPRVSNDLFLILDKKQKEEVRSNVRFRVEVSFVEIYTERVRDLLDPSLKNSRGSERLQDARIRQDPYSGPFVEGVTKYQVENWAQCCLLLERGSRHRTTCATAVHNQSSRSHAIFQLTVIQEETFPAKDRYSRPTVRCQAGRINLVDLAGSERGGFQDYVKESAAINTSLLALRRVIDNLTERQNMLMEQARAEVTGAFFQERPLPQVPFRDSVLTWLLSDSIGGNARTTMVATLSPLAKNYNDTLATLQWSSKARNLVTLVKVNDAQTTVTDGMMSKAGELHNAVRIQRQNMDMLLEALRNKKDRAEKLEKEMGNMQKQMEKHKDQMKQLVRECRAVTIQRVMQRLLWAKTVKTIQGQIKAVQQQTRQKKMSLDSKSYANSATLEKEKEMKRLVEEQKRESERVLRMIEEGKAGGDTFEEEYASVKEEFQTVWNDMNADQLLREYVGELQQDKHNENERIEAKRQEIRAAEERAGAMEEKVRQSKEPGWKERLVQLGKEAAVIRQKRDELQARLDELTVERNQLRSQLNK
ncbi:putative kinesin [Trypanosoma vivax]|nr:putative kinesin [Trypanosoma vivax]